MLKIARGGVLTTFKTKLFTATMAAAFVASLVAPNAAPLVGKASALTAGTVSVSGNTAAGENNPGWLFNRDTSTATPFEFNTGASSIGNGSLYVKPIGANASDKFIAENFLLSPVSNVSSISYDFKIGSGRSASDKDQFYMSVYANFGSSAQTKFYDCRYNVVPVAGSTSSFTTVTFDATQSYPVTTAGSSPRPCPTSPAAMEGLSPGSTIRAFALNVGDTSASDLGLDGYLDNVVVTTTSSTTTYDFDPAPPTAPTNGDPHNAYLPTNEFDFTWNASTGGKAPLTYEFQSSLDPAQSGGVLTTSLWKSGVLATPMIHSSGAPDGTWYWQVRAKDSNGLYSAWSNIWKVTLDHTAPTKPVLTGPANNSVVKGASITQSWSSASSDVHHYIYESYNNASATSLRWHEEFTTTSKTATNVADTTYWWRVKAVDHAGNVSAWSDLWKVTVDNTAPDVFITSPTAGFVDGTVEIRATLTDNNPHHYFLRIELQTGPSSWTTVFSQVYSDPTAFTDKLIHNWTPLVDGVYRISFEARDATGGTLSSGNKDAGSVASVIVTVDTAAPLVTIGPISNSSDSNRTITGTLDDTTATLTVEVDGVAQAATIVNNTWSVDLTGLAVGKHTVTAYAEDAAGNITNPAAEETFTTTAVSNPNPNTPNNPQNNQNNGGTPSNNNNNNNNAQTLAATTSTPEVLAEQSSKNDGDKEGTAKKIEQVAATRNNNFLGLGWWWMAVMAFVALLVVLFARRRANQA